MFFKKTNCPNCNALHDEMLDYCPLCGQRNEEHLDFKKRHPMTFVPWVFELILALLGLIGFTIINLIFGVIFMNALSENQTRGLMLVNTASYIVFFIMCIALLFPFFKSVIDRFKIPTAYLWGLLGTGALILASISSSLLIQLIRPESGEGGNQSAIIEMVKNYPIISIFIVGIIGPICEEVAYRVGLFTLLRRVHPALAYVATGIIFGLIHFDFTSSDLITELLYLPNYVFAGLCFSFIYEKKGIACSVTAHVLNNMISIIMILLPTTI